MFSLFTCTYINKTLLITKNESQHTFLLYFQEFVYRSQQFGERFQLDLNTGDNSVYKSKVLKNSSTNITNSLDYNLSNRKTSNIYKMPPAPSKDRSTEVFSEESLNYCEKSPSRMCPKIVSKTAEYRDESQNFRLSSFEVKMKPTECEDKSFLQARENHFSKKLKPEKSPECSLSSNRSKWAKFVDSEDAAVSSDDDDNEGFVLNHAVTGSSNDVSDLSSVDNLFTIDADIDFQL